MSSSPSSITDSTPLLLFIPGMPVESLRDRAPSPTSSICVDDGLDASKQSDHHPVGEYVKVNQLASADDTIDPNESASRPGKDTQSRIPEMDLARKDEETKTSRRDWLKSKLSKVGGKRKSRATETEDEMTEVESDPYEKERARQEEQWEAEMEAVRLGVVARTITFNRKTTFDEALSYLHSMGFLAPSFISSELERNLFAEQHEKLTEEVALEKSSAEVSGVSRADSKEDSPTSQPILSWELLSRLERFRWAYGFVNQAKGEEGLGRPRMCSDFERHLEETVAKEAEAAAEAATMENEALKTALQKAAESRVTSPGYSYWVNQRHDKFKEIQDGFKPAGKQISKEEFAEMRGEVEAIDSRLRSMAADLRSGPSLSALSQPLMPDLPSYETLEGERQKLIARFKKQAARKRDAERCNQQ